MPSSSEEETDIPTAEEEILWDGNWSMEGHDGMFLSLLEEDFLENQLEEFLEDQEEAGGALEIKDEFIDLDFTPDEEGFANLRDQVLQPRGLHIADVISWRILQGVCPPRIRVRRIPEVNMETLLELKQKGNQAFQKRQYRKAIEMYEEAFVYVEPEMYVGPVDQMREMVNILSNLSECYLRLCEYHQAGDEATNALLLDNSHVKSRLRRVKVEIELGERAPLIQAQLELEELLGDDENPEAVMQQATYCLEKVKKLLELEEKKFRREQPDGDWDLCVQDVRSRCW